MSGWVPFFFSLHVAAFIFIAVLISDYHFVDPSLYADVVATGSSDSINVANQLGRLDVLTLVLGVIGALVTVSAIMGFWFYRGVVDQRATDEVRERLPMILDEYIKKNPSLVAKALRANEQLVKAGLTAGDEGDFSEEIASAMDGGKEP